MEVVFVKKRYLFILVILSIIAQLSVTTISTAADESGESLIFCWHLPHFGDGSGGLAWIADDYKSVRPQYTVIKASSIKEALDESCDVFIKSPGPTPDNAEVYSVYSKRRLLDVPNLRCMGFSSSTYHTCAKLLSTKIFESFDAGTPNYQKVIAEREEYRRRQQPQVSAPAGISKEDLTGIVQAAVEGATKAQKRDITPVRVIESDIDKPAYQLSENPDDFAIVIGIDKYLDLPQAMYAERDAEAVKKHLIALGYPSRNVVHLSGEKAGRSSIEKFLETWLPRNINENSRVFFYFSGHGAPDTKTGQAYLVPWDGDVNFLENTAYPVKRLYDKLNALKARQVIVVLDSCFSGGGGRSVLAKGTRPLVIHVDNSTVNLGKILSFSASAANEITGAIDDQGHGAFTYYFLKGISGAAMDKSGNVTARSLYNYLLPKVQDAARRQNRDQTPQLMPTKGTQAQILLR
jgi:Caspase domain